MDSLEAKSLQKEYVKVVVKIKPLTSLEKILGCKDCVTLPGEHQVQIGDHCFAFDNVYGASILSSYIFEECVAPLVDAVFHGYNATVLAYGQAGSGKTYTMGTNFTAGVSSDGIIPQVMKSMFKKADELEKNIEFLIKVSFIEIFNQEIFDLLDQNDACRIDNNSTFAKPSRPSIQIRETPNGGIILAGVTEAEVRSKEDMASYLMRGSQLRATRSTNMNNQSSRSHAIFTICLEQKKTADFCKDRSVTNDFTADILLAKFHLVDLAGSERVKRTGSDGLSLKEGIHINKGLLALGNVIRALGDETKKKDGGHVPFRDNKLTRFLQDSLGGNSKTVMIACISSADSNSEETINTLKYANRARNIQNKVMINRNSASIEMQKLRIQLEHLQSEVLFYRGSGTSFEEVQVLREKVTLLEAINTELHKALKEYQVTSTEHASNAQVEKVVEKDKLIMMIESSCSGKPWDEIDYMENTQHTEQRKVTEQIHVPAAKLQDAFNENAKLNVKNVEDAKLWNDSKLQDAFNENAKLNVKNVEDAKLWNDLDANFFSKKALSDNLAEENKNLIGERFFDNTKTFDSFKLQLNDLSTKLQCTENTIKSGKQEICKLIEEKDALEKNFKVELYAADEVIKKKGSLIKDLEDANEQSKQHMRTLDSQLQAVQHELISKEEILKSLNLTKDELESEKKMLQCNNNDLKQQIENSCLEIKNLKEIFHNLTTKISQLDKDSLTISNNVLKLITSFEKYYDLLHQEKELTLNHNQGKNDKLQLELLNAMTKNNSFQLHNEQLNNKIIELQKAQEFVMVQHADERRLAEDKVHMLNSEVDKLLSRKNELEKLSIKLEARVKQLSEVYHTDENKLQELSKIISKLELENQDNQCRMQLKLKEKIDETEAPHDEIRKYDKHSNTLGIQNIELCGVLDEKEKLKVSFKERERLLEEQKSEGLQKSTIFNHAEAVTDMDTSDSEDIKDICESDEDWESKKIAKKRRYVREKFDTKDETAIIDKEGLIYCSCTKYSACIYKKCMCRALRSYCNSNCRCITHQCLNKEDTLSRLDDGKTRKLGTLLQSDEIKNANKKQKFNDRKPLCDITNEQVILNRGVAPPRSSTMLMNASDKRK